jgi:hypothetical protein
MRLCANESLKRDRTLVVVEDSGKVLMPEDNEASGNMQHVMPRTSPNLSTSATSFSSSAIFKLVSPCYASYGV